MGEQHNIFQALKLGTDILSVISTSGEIKRLSQTTSPDQNDSPEFETIYDIVHPQDEDNIKTALQKVENTENNIQTHCRIKINEKGWKIYDTTVISGDQFPSIQGYILVGKDITDRYRYEQRRQVINRVLRHNIRNDMNLIMGYANHLDEITDAGTEYTTNIIHDRAESLANLAEKIREIDRQLYGPKQKFKKINIGSVLKNQVKLAHQKYPHVEIATKIESSKIIANDLIGDAIQTIIENSIENNNKQNPRIQISNKNPTETHALIKIEDNGHRISKEEIATLTNGIETPLNHSNGLSLWAVKWVIEGVNGSLSIKNKPSGGKCTSISFITEDEGQSSINPSKETISTKSEILKLKNQVESMKSEHPIETTTRG